MNESFKMACQLTYHTMINTQYCFIFKMTLHTIDTIILYVSFIYANSAFMNHRGTDSTTTSNNNRADTH